MALTNYVVQLYSEADPQYINGITEVKEVGSSVYLYSGEGDLAAVYESSDIQKLAPLSQS